MNLVLDYVELIRSYYCTILILNIFQTNKLFQLAKFRIHQQSLLPSRSNLDYEQPAVSTLPVDKDQEQLAVHTLL